MTKKGAEELQKAFSDIPVTKINVLEGLHLKSSMTMLSKDVILVGTSVPGTFIRDQIKAKAKYAEHYKFVEIDEDQNGSANVLYFNDRLLYPSHYEHLYKEMNEFKQFHLVKSLDNSEFKKIDGCLTCRCVFFNKGTSQ